MNTENRKNIGLVVMFVIVFAALFVFTYYLNSKSETPTNTPQTGEEIQGNGDLPIGPADYKDATYVIDGEEVTLKDGVSEVSVPNSNNTVVTSYFGNELRHDVDGDGREDVVFLVTYETGGTGVFYYVVAALNTPNGYIGSQGFYLGDRIAPQTTEKGRGRIVIVNYTDRREGESFSTKPSVGKSVWLFLDKESMQFGIVEQNFEGEADPDRMSLQMKTWVWTHALLNDGTNINPKKSGDFTLNLGSDGKFNVTTDCNSAGGSYTASEEGKIEFKGIFMTKMYCEGSQEATFIKLLEDSTGYLFTGKGELVLDLKFDSGQVVFR